MTYFFMLQNKHLKQFLLSIALKVANRVLDGGVNHPKNARQNVRTINPLVRPVTRHRTAHTHNSKCILSDESCNLEDRETSVVYAKGVIFISKQISFLRNSSNKT